MSRFIQVHDEDAGWTLLNTAHIIRVWRMCGQVHIEIASDHYDSDFEPARHNATKVIAVHEDFESLSAMLIGGAA